MLATEAQRYTKSGFCTKMMRYRWRNATHAKAQKHR
jgi:hypothetical protein